MELLDKDFLDKEFNQISSDFREIISNLVKRLRKTNQRLVVSPRRKEERAKVKIRISFKKASDFLGLTSVILIVGGYLLEQRRVYR